MTPQDKRRALIEDAARASRRGRPLFYHPQGFWDLRRPGGAGPIHAFQTVEAARRRGLVVVEGEGFRRKLYITATGLDVLSRA